MSRIPQNITFVTLPKVLAQFHHLPEHVPIHEDHIEEARQKGYPFEDGVRAMKDVLQADPQVPGSYLYRMFVEKWPIWREAERLLTAGRLDSAIQALVGILDIDPECPLTCFQLGFCFRATGELEKSESFYKQALRMAPDVGWIYSNLGRTYQAMGDESKAIEAYWQALERLPKDLFVLEQLETLGEIVLSPPEEDKPFERSYLRRKEFEDGLRSRAATAGNTAEIVALGQKALGARLWKTAIDCFEKARERSNEGTEMGETELGLGVALLGAGRAKEAERWLLGYLDHHPGSAAAHLNLFKAYRILQEEDASLEERAREEIHEAASFAPDDLGVLREFFSCFNQADREEEALNILKAMTDENPGIFGPILLRAQLCDSRGDWDTAEALLKEALKRSPSNEEVLLYYTAALGRHGRATDAVEMLFGRKQDATFALTVNLVLSLRQCGRMAEALKALEEFKDRKKAPPLDRIRAEVLWRELHKENPSSSGCGDDAEATRS